ncbi:MAG: hypothetical protein ABIO63_05860, partial [Casimicrobiaceae bacterium]
MASKIIWRLPGYGVRTRHCIRSFFGIAAGPRQLTLFRCNLSRLPTHRSAFQESRRAMRSQASGRPPKRDRKAALAGGSPSSGVASIAEAAIRFCITHPAMGTILVGVA